MYFLDDLDEEDYEIAIKVSEIFSRTKERSRPILSSISTLFLMTRHFKRSHQLRDFNSVYFKIYK